MFGEARKSMVREEEVLLLVTTSRSLLLESDKHILKVLRRYVGRLLENERLTNRLSFGCLPIAVRLERGN